MITWRGFLYILTMTAMYLVMAYSGFLSLLLVFFVMLMLPVLSALQLLIACRMVDIEQYILPNPVERKDKTVLQIIFRQRGPFMQGYLDYSVQLSGRKGRKRFLRRQTVLLSGDSREKRVSMICQHHGHYPIGLSRVWARDLFGLFYLPARFKLTLKKARPILTVWPRPAGLETLDELASFLKLQPQQISQQFGDEVYAIANLRHYQPGDSMKRVHWKLTARLNETMIKEFEKPLQQETLLLYDMEKLNYQNLAEMDYLDHFKDYAAELACQAVRNGSRLHSVWYGKDGRNAVEIENASELSLVQWQLTDLSYAAEWPVNIILQEEKKQIQVVWTLFLMTNRLSSETADMLVSLKQNGYRTCVLFVQEHQQHLLPSRLTAYLDQHKIKMVTLPAWNLQLVSEKTEKQTEADRENREDREAEKESGFDSRADIGSQDSQSEKRLSGWHHRPLLFGRRRAKKLSRRQDQNKVFLNLFLSDTQSKNRQSKSGSRQGDRSGNDPK